MKRVCLLLFLLLFLTGCDINYNLNFNGNTIYEEIKGTIDNEYVSDIADYSGVNFYYDLLYFDKSPLINNEDEIYQKEIIDKNGYKEFTFNYTYYNNYNDSYVVNECFDSFSFDENDEYYIVNLNGPFTCLFGDKIFVNVTSDYNVIDSNAKSIKKNTYKWVIDKDNKDDLNINIVFSKTKKDNSENNIFSVFQIIGLIILLLLSFITYFLYKKKNKNSTI